MGVLERCQAITADRSFMLEQKRVRAEMLYVVVGVFWSLSLTRCISAIGS